MCMYTDNAVQPIVSICHLHVVDHAENLNQSKIQSGNSCNHSQRGHRAISHVSNLNIFLENNISNWNSNNWSNCNNLHLFFYLLTLIETTNVIYQSKVVIYVMCIGCRAGGTEG